MRKKEQKKIKMMYDLLQAVTQYSVKSLKDKEVFAIGMSEIVDILVKFISTVLVSACNALKMDREKFVLYVNQVTNEIKQECIKIFNQAHNNEPR